MATFTLELHKAYAMRGGSYTRVDGRIVLDHPEYIGLDAYPVFQPSGDTLPARDRINGLIFDHYMNEEIGHETIELFAQSVRSHMNLHMPYFNQLFESCEHKFNPLVTTDMRNTASSNTVGDSQSDTTSNSESSSDALSKTDTTGLSESETTSHSESDAVAESDNDSTSETDSRARAVGSTTPQATLRNTGDYASSAQDTTSATKTTNAGHEESSSASTEDVTASGTQTDTGTSETTDTASAEQTSNTLATTDYTTRSDDESHAIGYTGVPADLIQAYRDAMLNIDQMIVESLSEMFMQLWNTSDSYTQAAYPYYYPNRYFY